MPRVPGLSLSTYELNFYVKAQTNREKGISGSREKGFWDIDSSQYDIDYLLIPLQYVDSDQGVKAKYLGALGSYLVEIRVYSHSMKVNGGFTARASFGYAIHAPTGTVSWDYSAKDPHNPMLSFREAEKEAILSLSGAQLQDAFRDPTEKQTKTHLFDGRVV